MTKDKLRRKYKQLRNNLSIAEKNRWNEQILNHLKRIDWNSYRYVHVYLPLEKFSEPDTAPFIKWVQHTHPHIRLVISKSDFHSGEMTHYLLEKDTILIENKWGILEPEHGIIVNPDKIDIILVPLLVLDMRGNRVGYGKGFYDRFILKCNKNVKTIGISFFEPLDLIIHADMWDIKINGCVTPTKIYEFTL